MFKEEKMKSTAVTYTSTYTLDYKNGKLEIKHVNDYQMDVYYNDKEVGRFDRNHLQSS